MDGGQNSQPAVSRATRRTSPSLARALPAPSRTCLAPLTAGDRGRRREQRPGGSETPGQARGGPTAPNHVGRHVRRLSLGLQLP